MKFASNLKDQTITTESGKNVRNTKQLSGMARESKDFRAKNKTVEHKGKNASFGSGKPGGRASH